MAIHLKWLADQGATLVKVRPRDKRPLEIGWQNKPQSLQDIPAVPTGWALSGARAPRACVRRGKQV